MAILIDNLFCVSGHWRHEWYDEINNDVHSFIIQRDVEGNFLFFLKDLYRYILEEIFERKSDFAVTDNTVIFGFKEGS